MRHFKIPAVIMGLCLAGPGVAALANSSAMLTNYTQNSWVITGRVQGSDPGVKVLLVRETPDAKASHTEIDFKDPSGVQFVLRSQEAVAFGVVSSAPGNRSNVYFDIAELNDQAKGGIEGWIHLSFAYPKSIDEKPPFDTQCKLRGFFVGEASGLPYHFVPVNAIDLHLEPTDINACSNGLMCVIL